jgi:hypothetical protein
VTRSKFEIGETEKHTIFVNNSMLMKKIIIEIDGEKVVDEPHFSPLGKKFQFDVGSSEKHHLDISAGGFSTTKLFVDGKAVQDQETERASQRL